MDIIIAQLLNEANHGVSQSRFAEISKEIGAMGHVMVWRGYWDVR